MRTLSFLVAALLFLATVPTLAQTAPSDGTPTRIRGTVEKLDGQILLVKSRDGQDLSIGLAPNYTIAAVVKRSLADIKTGDYVASTSVKGTDGKLHAVEVHIFPEAMRGTGEGQFAWDLVPDSLMTNATVTGISEGTRGHTLKVAYKGNESEVIVGPDAPVVGYVQGNPGLLKPGAAVFLVALKKPDGSLSAARVTAEKDGVKPPM